MRPTAAIGAWLLLVLGATAPAFAGEPPAAPTATAAASPPPPLSASLTGLAKAEYEAGKVLYGDGDFGNAVIKFQRVYELSHDARALWNVAVCEKNLRRYTRVITTLDQYLKEAGPLLSAEDRQEATDLAAAARPLVSKVTLTVSEPGAEIFVDDDKAGTTPLPAPLVLDLGKRKIRVQKPGFKAYESAQQLAGGTDLSLKVDLVKDVHQGRVVVEASPKDLISLDGKMVGQGRWEGKLQSGGHTLKVTAAGMAAYQSEVVVQDDKTRQISVTLNPLAKGTDPSTWLWIAGGTLLAAGAVVGGVFLFQPTERPSVQGTLGTYTLSFGGGRR